MCFSEYFLQYEKQTRIKQTRGRLEFGLFGQPLLTYTRPPSHMLSSKSLLLSFVTPKVVPSPKSKGAIPWGPDSSSPIISCHVFINSGQRCFLKWPHWELFCACLCVRACRVLSFFYRVIQFCQAPNKIAPPPLFFYSIKKENWKFFLLVFFNLL